MKIVVDGETFDLDFELGHVKMSFALAIEKIAGTRYVQWETDLLAGGAEATAALICLAWKRDGREAEMKDILEGKTDCDFSQAYRSIAEALAQQMTGAGTAAGADPTPGAETGTAPDGTDSTRNDTKRRSRGT